jgi:hypothetical protein
MGGSWSYPLTYVQTWRGLESEFASPDATISVHFVEAGISTGAQLAYAARVLAQIELRNGRRYGAKIRFRSADFDFEPSDADVLVSREQGGDFPELHSKDPCPDALSEALKEAAAHYLEVAGLSSRSGRSRVPMSVTLIWATAGYVVGGWRESAPCREARASSETLIRPRGKSQP